MISRTSAWFLVLAGLFNMVIWPRFAKAIADDDRAWAGAHWSSDPTAFFWVHALLIVTAFSIGVGVLVVGVRAVLARRRAAPDA